jgi:hypothetical protein
MPVDDERLARDHWWGLLTNIADWKIFGRALPQQNALAQWVEK